MIIKFLWRYFPLEVITANLTKPQPLNIKPEASMITLRKGVVQQFNMTPFAITMELMKQKRTSLKQGLKWLPGNCIGDRQAVRVIFLRSRTLDYWRFINYVEKNPLPTFSSKINSSRFKIYVFKAILKSFSDETSSWVKLAAKILLFSLNIFAFSVELINY